MVKFVTMNQEDLFSLDDLSDLPQELRDELVASKRDDYEKKIIELFKLSGGNLNIDQIQIAFYRKYGEHKARNKITTKLYNMARSSSPAIESVQGKKGVYKLRDGFNE